MPKIKILPPEVRKKIAAGEVVERPASVVKELVENAFDARANTIKISIVEGGIKEISVYDDGEGMEPEDLRLCYKHHATSKISSVADIFKIVSFGFRGEALASISQVSKLLIKSKHISQNQAYQVYVEFGEEKEFKPCHLVKGTLVVVKDLFSNLPARKAFLKSPRSETQKIAELVKALSFCFPEVKITLMTLSGKKENLLFSWRGGSTEDLISLVTQVKKEYIIADVFEKKPYNFEVFLSSTAKTFPHTKYLYTIVNNRLVKDDKLNKIIISCLKPFYGNLGYPAGVIRIYAPYHLVDVNVHPAKWEVRFREEKELFEGLKQAIEKLFKKKKAYALEKQSKEATETLVREPISTYAPKPKEFSPKPRPLVCEKVIEEEKVKYLGTFKNAYFIFEINDELYIIDQHALSERVIFEELLQRYSKNFTKQELLIPVLLNTEAVDYEKLKDTVSKLNELGFSLEVIDTGEVILKAYPGIFGEEVIEAVEKVLSLEFAVVEDLKREVIAEYACKLAKKKGDFIDQREAIYLVKKMLENGLSTCPHGRPLFFKIEEAEIEKRLRRRV
ncbi:MAG: DNA mismatch repair endonuclease MutL [Thermodesulfobacteria bacterium]|nr:DNA mismatch repair endonuclease MutL [Thermodesulfobacteriota bacterium]